MANLFTSFLRRMTGMERRSGDDVTTLAEPAKWLLDALGGTLTEAGVRIDARTALQVSTFLTCVDLIAGKIASLPLNVYERSYWNGRPVRRLAHEHASFHLVNSEPNDEMTAPTLWKVFLIHVLAWGAGFIEIQWDEDRRPINLWPLDPSCTKLHRVTSDFELKAELWRPWAEYIPEGTLVCETVPSGEKRRIIPMSSVVYLPGISFDGRLGKSTVDLCRRTLGLATALERFGSKYFANFAKPGGILELPHMSQQDKDRARDALLNMISGENAQRTLTLPAGSKWTSITNNPQEAQAIEARNHVRAEIAALFHLAPRFVGDTAKNSRATNEQDSLELLEYTLRPHMNALCHEIKRKLFPSTPGIDGTRQPSSYFVAFDEWQLIRPDAASREQFYASGKQWSFMNTNDIREHEGLNPIEQDWAEQYIMPVNMTLVTTPVDPRRDKIPSGENGASQ